MFRSGGDGFCRVLYDLKEGQFRLEQNWESKDQVLGSVSREIQEGIPVFLSVSCKGPHIRARIGTSAGGSEIAEWIVRGVMTATGALGLMSSDCTADALFDYFYVGDPEWNPFGGAPAVFEVHGVGGILNPSYEDGSLMGWETFQAAGKQVGTMERINDPVHIPRPECAQGRFRASMSWGTHKRQVGGGLYQTVTELTPNQPLYLSVKMCAAAMLSSKSYSTVADKIGIFWIEAGEADFSSGLPGEARWIADLPVDSRDIHQWIYVQGEFIPTGASVIVGAYWNFSGQEYADIAVHLDDWQLEQKGPGTQ